MPLRGPPTRTVALASLLTTMNRARLWDLSRPRGRHLSSTDVGADPPLRDTPLSLASSIRLGSSLPLLDDRCCLAAEWRVSLCMPRKVCSQPRYLLALTCLDCSPPSVINLNRLWMTVDRAPLLPASAASAWLACALLPRTCALSHFARSGWLARSLGTRLG